MRPHLPSMLLLLVVLSAVTFQAYSSAGYPTAVWTRIKKPEEYQHAVDLAKFAIGWHNKQTDGHLELVGIIRAYASGTYYKIVVSCLRPRIRASKYETFVLENAPNNGREVIYFQPMA
ncbi:uncharacterized protein LOC144702534 [Wolffia australiana]